MNIVVTIDSLKKIAAEKKYLIYEDKLNIWGVRAIDMTPNKFNDLLVVFYKDTKGTWIINQYKLTTDPGSYWLLNPLNVEGTFIMLEGQYIDSHTIGLHKGYPALVQCGKLKGYRDKDKDNVLDLDPNAIKEIGLSGVNIHHAGEDSVQVDKWSAGCQVLAKMKDWIKFFMTVTTFKKVQSKFTYTLINERDLLKFQIV